MVSFTAQELIPSSEFAKKFGSYLTLVKEQSVEKLAILKNNKIEAVLISKDEYEMMAAALKEKEAKAFTDTLATSLDDLQTGKVHSIDTLWDELDG